MFQLSVNYAKSGLADCSLREMILVDLIQIPLMLLLKLCQNGKKCLQKRNDGVVISKVVSRDRWDFASAGTLCFKQTLLCIQSRSVVSQQCSTIQKITTIDNTTPSFRFYFFFNSVEIKIYIEIEFSTTNIVHLHVSWCGEGLENNAANIWLRERIHLVVPAKNWNKSCLSYFFPAKYWSFSVKIREVRPAKKSL